MDKVSAARGFKALTWEDLCVDRSLRDLPFKIELNRYNQIVMAPADARHSRYQARVLHLLQRLLKGGEAIAELAVQTNDNVKVPDVIWASRKTIKAHDGESSWSAAPEICVEVLSPTNARSEMKLKRALYFQRGAQEVWLCSLEGKMTFYSPAGELSESILCPKFPALVKL